MSVEPRMEDLLASIRKAIHDDTGFAPATSGQSSGVLFKGAMRELHVKVGDEVGSAADEIQHLRERINHNRTNDGARDRAATATPGYPSSLAAELESRRSTAQIGYSAAPARRFDEGARTLAPVEPVQTISSWEHEHYHRPVNDYRPSSDPGRPAPHEALVSPQTAASTGAAFQQLAESLLNRATGERSVEDVTRELLRGMLRQWLDDNLPSLVERLVREEIERVARRGR